MHAQLRRQLDGLDPTGLVEAVAVAVIDAREDRAGALAVHPPHERLVGEGAIRVEIEDGLEGHREIEAQGARLAAFVATDRLERSRETRAHAPMIREAAIASLSDTVSRSSGAAVGAVSPAPTFASMAARV